jgi:predicted AAA+ superfamily ATPase
MMFQYIHQQIEKGEINYDDILYINFEDERISHIKVSQLDLFIESFMELFDKKPLIFLDEIQNIEGWEKFVRRLADSKYRVFVTGSNAKMLSRDIYTTLGGRFIIKEIFPFSFQEFLLLKGIILNKNWEYTDERNNLAKLFDSYFHFGGLPESFELTDKRGWLNSLYHKILLGDIITRNNIRNESAIKLLVKKIAESVMQPVSIVRLQNILNSSGLKVSRNSVSDYLEYLKEFYLIFNIVNYSDKLVQKESYKKRYFLDNGILNNFLFDPETKLLENIVAIELFKKYGQDLYYLKRNTEIDFYIPDKSLAIQVAYDIENDVTMERELNALRVAAKYYKIQNLLIITRNTEKCIENHNYKINVLPVWKWILRA